ncbi:hypothetical protein EDC04DRAFT_2985860 [Pisolithus marmoratus]|nr:hypothetical protein EDC04DRAFT_2985860 [Pisolithus marmoratus]
MSLLSPPSTNSTPLSHYHSLTPSPATLTSPLGTPSPASSSVSISLTAEDEENITITANRSLVPSGRRKSQEDIRLLAILTHITELSYSLSDIQTRIFEIQELRHKPQTDGGVDAAVTAEIDNALMSMTDRLETIDRGLKTVNESIAPFRPAGGERLVEASELAVVLRKHATLLQEWDTVQQETDELQQELKEDKWITVFRTVTEQADGMMASLEKAVNKCQDFIRLAYKRGDGASRVSCSSLRSEKSPVTLETFNTLLGSFNAKKEHYVPATAKVLSIMDNGVRNRVTKNGEALRRHGEAAKRWRLLQERMDRTEREMEKVRKMLVSADQAFSEAGSSSGNTTNGYLATPPSGSLKGSRASSRTSRGKPATSSLSRSMSPLKKLAKRLTGSVRSPVTPPESLPVSRASSQSLQSQTLSEPPAKIIRRQRSSLFTFEVTNIDASVTLRQKSTKQPWNASTKVEPDGQATIKPNPSKRPTAISVISSDRAPLAPCTPSHRSLSRSSNSNASSRPWSPVTSSISTAPSSNPSIPPLPISYRPPSRAQTPGLGTTPRPRPRTPSCIPVPALSLHGRSTSSRQPGSDDDTDEAELTLMQRAFSPTLTQSTSSPGARARLRSGTPSGSRVPPPRPPSRSRIPLPSVHVSSESRPSSTLSFYRPESPLDVSRSGGSLSRAQTPESTLRTRAQQVPVFTAVRPTARPSLPGVKVPPSSYRDASTTRVPSRPGSRAGAHTPNFDSQQPMNIYVPSSPKDPLDAEVAAIVNSIPHGLLIERVDPPLKSIPKEGAEIRASYAFSNSLARKVVTCRLTTLTRSGSRTSGETTTKKVMCRVGGGWQDLQLYMLNRQAGL